MRKTTLQMTTLLGFLLILVALLLAACAGPGEETGEQGEKGSTQVEGTSAPGPLVPEVTAEGSGGSGGEGSLGGGAEGTSGEKFGLPDAQACQEMAETLENGLGVPDTNVTVEEESEFSDASTGLASPACQIALSATGVETPSGASLEEFSNRVLEILMEMGFSSDEAAATQENPNGRAYLLRRGTELASIEIDASPLEFEDCPQDSPIDECNLPLEQIGYSLRVFYSQLEVDSP